nr:hypothetical protein [Tanacetum cinerariifolium]
MILVGHDDGGTRKVHLRTFPEAYAGKYDSRVVSPTRRKRFLYDNLSPRPPEEFVSENFNADIESFSPSPIMEEIDLTFTPDGPMPPCIEEDDDDSRDTLIREKLLDNYSLPIHVNESFHFDIPSFSRPPAKPPDGNTGILNVKMMGDVSDQKIVQKNLKEKQLEEAQAVKAQSWKFPVSYDDDDGEEGYNSLNDNITSELPSYSAVIPTEPVDSLSMGDEHLNTIPTTESDEFIKSFIISSKIDSLFDEFICELTLLKSFPPRINETNCQPEKKIRFAKRLLYDNSSPCPPEEIVSDISNADIESFSPSPIPNKDSDPLMEEIDLSFNPDEPMPPGIEGDDDDSERDISILEELLDNYSLSLPANESYHFDIPSPYRPPTKPPDGITGTLNIKMMGDVSDQKVPIPNPTITRIFNQEKSPDLLSYLGFEAFQPSAECPMIINGKNTPVLDVLFSIFTPLDQLKDEFCSLCNSRAENSFIYDSNPNSFDNPPDFSYQRSHHHVETYSCELCGNDFHYGYDCPPRFLLVYEQKSSYKQNFGDNYYPQNSPSFPLQFLCCENCGGPHEIFQCQPMNQNYFEPNHRYNSNYSGFDRPSQYPIDQSAPQEMSIQDMEVQKQQYLEKMRKQAANLSTYNAEPSRRFNFICYDDDDEEKTIPLRDIISQLPLSIVITTSPPVLPIKDPEDSLIMGNEEHPEKESNEVIKSSAEDLVPIPSESEDTSRSDSECDLLACDDFSPIDVPEGKSMTFSNPLFDSNADFTSSDDESLFNEDVPEDNVKLYSNPLFKFNDEYISSDVNSLFDEMLKDIESKVSYDSNLDEPALLVRPLFDSNEDECFDPGGDVDEINAFDILSNFEDSYYDSEGDVSILRVCLVMILPLISLLRLKKTKKRTKSDQNRTKTGSRLGSVGNGVAGVGVFVARDAAPPVVLGAVRDTLIFTLIYGL